MDTLYKILHYMQSIAISIVTYCVPTEIIEQTQFLKCLHHHTKKSRNDGGQFYLNENRAA